MKLHYAPFACFEAHVGPQSARGAHTHDIHEFFVCTDDNGTQFAGRTAIPQHRGDTFLFPAGMPHYCSGRPRAPAVGYVIMVPGFMFAPETYGDRETCLTLRRAVSLAQSGRNPLPLRKETARRVLSLAEEMVREVAGRQPGYQAASRLLLQNVFLQMMRDPNVGADAGLKSRATYHGERMAPVLRFIDAHFMEAITVERMATMACMSRSHFHAVFREVAGCAMIDYVTRVRIRAAQRLLRESDAPVIQISMDCGFASLSRFYEAFKRIAGKTPREVRAES